MDCWKVNPFLFWSFKGECDRGAAASAEHAHMFKVFMLVLEMRSEEVDVFYISTCIYCCVFDCDSYCAKLSRSQDLRLEGVVGDRKGCSR